ncbi:hypothetical protein [Parafannyhessea umbonata]|uniref:hypothetical protein n=1 Tax=Parafannyhessea umbonata TaxID=604330 RepID=UPI0012FDF6A9|nr:hypothetical protein [Parafannyhessea umbonata]
MEMRLGRLGRKKGAITLFLTVAFALDWACRLVTGSRSGWAIEEFSGVWGLLLAVSMFAPLAVAAAKAQLHIGSGQVPTLSAIWLLVHVADGA